MLLQASTKQNGGVRELAQVAAGGRAELDGLGGREDEP